MLNDFAWLDDIPHSWSEVGRALSGAERESLISQGCRSEHWESITVAENFSPAHYEQVQFVGHCYLESQNGELEHDGMSFACGIRHVKLTNVFCSQNIHIDGCSQLSDVFLSKNVILHGVTLLKGRDQGWTAERALEVGNELGGRVLSICPSMTMAMATKALSKTEFAKDELQKMKEWRRAQRNFSVLGQNVTILSCPRVSDVCLGPFTQVDRALGVSETVTLSGRDEPVVFGAGTELHGVYAQWGAKVEGSAQCRDVMLAEQSHVSHGAMVEQAFLGPNTQIGKGEVTACLLGPFVAMHHQSLLIGVLWPEGMGNVGYGANVGSNHTGKAPDQEFFPGEGCFLGLSCSIKFPANFKASPYSTVSTGVITLPQRLEMPFSLINSRAEMLDGVSPALNELMPAWVLGENLYALIRNELKYQKRNKAKRFVVESRWLRQEIVLWMAKARHQLASLKDKRWYDGSDSPALGKNVLSEAWRLRGIALYDRFLAHHAIDDLLRKALGENIADAASPLTVEAEDHVESWLAPFGLVPTDIKSLAQWWLDDLAQQIEDVRASKGRDFSRGRRIVDDYDAAHVDLEDDPVLDLAQQRWESGLIRVKPLLL